MNKNNKQRTHTLQTPQRVAHRPRSSRSDQTRVSCIVRVSLGLALKKDWGAVAAPRAVQRALTGRVSASEAPWCGW